MAVNVRVYIFNFTVSVGDGVVLDFYGCLSSVILNFESILNFVLERFILKLLKINSLRHFIKLFPKI